MSSTYYKISYEDCVSIASAIRAKGGVIDDPIQGSMFASAIRNLVTQEEDRQSFIDYFTGAGFVYNNSASGTVSIPFGGIKQYSLPNATSLNGSGSFNRNCSIYAPNVETAYCYYFYERSYIQDIYMPKLKNLYGGLFQETKIKSIDYSMLTSLNGSSIMSCPNLSYINLPVYPHWLSVSNCAQLKSIYAKTAANVNVRDCPNLETIYCPNFTGSAFASTLYECTNLLTVVLPINSFFQNNNIAYCSRLLSVYLTHSSVVTTNNALSDTFYSTPLTNTAYTGGQYMTIYVPSSLYSAYISASYWSEYASRIASIGTSDLSFKIGSNTYYGAAYTWNTWVGASENTDGFVKMFNNIMDSGHSHVVCYNGTPVFPTDAIGWDHDYELLSFS